MHVIDSVVHREISAVADTLLKGMCSVAGVVSSVMFAVADKDYMKLPV